MATLILTKGLPYSGKTTWARAWVQAKNNRIRLSWREVRAMMTTINDRAHTALAVNVTVRAMLRALDAGYDVVLDERNLYGPEWTLFYSMAQRHKHKVKWQYVKAKPEECKERCLSAGGSTAQCMEIDRLWEVYRSWLEKK